jgi:hypothetical protein
VCILERGDERVPGEYPNTLEGALPNIQVTMPDGSVYGKRNFFYEY